MHFFIPEEYDNSIHDVCNKGYIQCENHTICVPRNKICDGNSDCPDKSDEMKCGKCF